MDSELENDHMTDEQHLADGFALLEKMIGPQDADRMRRGWHDLSPDLERLILSFVAGQIWTRSGLDLKTRSLCTVAALTALGKTNALELNVRMAVGNGATREEIIEAVLQMAPYAGFPAVWDGLKIATKILSQES
jgi:4-carboxymuconolactone decarboxylase